MTRPDEPADAAVSGDSASAPSSPDTGAASLDASAAASHAPASPPPAAATLDGARVWIVSDGAGERARWIEPLVDALRAGGAASVDVMALPNALGSTARGVIGQGAERVARALRLARRDQPDASAFDVLADSRPDIVLFDNPAAVRAMALVRDATGTRALHVGLIATLHEAARWRGVVPDAIVVPDPALLHAAGLSALPSRVAGPPRTAGFSDPPSRDAARAALGLGERPTVLVDVEGTSPTAIDSMLASLSAVDAELLFHYGRDSAVAETLRVAAATRGVPANIFGFVDDLETFVSASDVFVAGPESPYVAAALGVARAVVSTDPSVAATRLAQDGRVAVAAVQQLAPVIESRIAADVEPPERLSGNSAIARAVAELVRDRDVAPPPVEVAPAVQQRSRFERVGVGPTPPLAPMSRDEARSRLAQLILDERAVEAAIAEKAQERDRWFERLALAEEGGEADLAAFATGRAEEATGEIARLNAQMNGIQRQKDEVRRRAAAGTRAGREAVQPQAANAEDIEARFRRLEREGDLARLRAAANDGEDP